MRPKLLFAVIDMPDGSDTKEAVLKPKDLVGFLGAAGEVCAALAKLPGKYTIFIFLVSSLFMVIWGNIVRKEAGPSFRRA